MAINILNNPHVNTLKKQFNLYLRLKLKTCTNQNLKNQIRNR